MKHNIYYRTHVVGRVGAVAVAKNKGLKKDQARGYSLKYATGGGKNVSLVMGGLDVGDAVSRGGVCVG